MIIDQIVHKYDVVLEQDVALVVKSTDKLKKRVRDTVWDRLEHLLVNPALRSEDIVIHAPHGLKDSEARAIAIYCLITRDTLASWKVHEFLDKYKAQSGDPQLALLLDCFSLDEALYRLANLGQTNLTKLHRNLADNLSAGLRKLRVRKKSGKVNVPQRKKGYNDKGSMDPDSAWKHARAYWLDDEMQRSVEQRRRVLQDTIAFLDGFSS